MFRLPLFITITIAVLIFSNSCYGQHNVQVKIENVKERKGTVYIAICNDPENFIEKELQLLKVKVTSTGEVKATFNKLTAGSYAIRLFQDVNDSGKMETGIFGIPKEPFGFSNNPAKLSRPSFQKSSFKVEKDLMITIYLQNF